MKVTFSTKWLVPWNGTCQVCVRIAEGLVDEGHKVSIITNEGNTKTDWFTSDIEVVQKPRRPIKGYKIIRDHLTEFEPDILHSHDNLGYYFEPFSIPHVVTSHSNWPRSWFLSKKHFLEGFALEIPHDILLRAATQPVAVSDYSRRQLEKRRIKPDQIYNGVKVPDIDETVTEDGTKNLLFVGRVGPRKGKYLPEIWDKIQERGTNIELDIIGYPADDSLSKQLEAANDVEFHGSVESLSPYYEKADALLFPSRAEACPLTVLEAQAYGTPVIAFDICSHNELINTGHTGSVAPAYDTHKFASEALNWVSKDRSETISVCRQWILDNYSNQNMIEEYIELYERIVDSY